SSRDRRATVTPRCALFFNSPSSERIRVASRMVFRETPSEAAVGTSCSGVPGVSSPFRMRCRSMEATWSATDTRLISEMTCIALRERGGEADILLRRQGTVKCSTIPSLDCSTFALDTPRRGAYHPGNSPFHLGRGRRWGQFEVQRQVVKPGCSVPALF